MWPTRSALISIVSAGGADHRANDNAFIHACGDLREDFTNLNAGHFRGNRLELAADLGRRFSLDVPQVLMRWTAAQEDIDDCFMAIAAGAHRRDTDPAGLGPQNVGERE